MLVILDIQAKCFDLICAKFILFELIIFFINIS